MTTYHVIMIILLKQYRIRVCIIALLSLQYSLNVQAQSVDSSVSPVAVKPQGTEEYQPSKCLSAFAIGLSLSSGDASFGRETVMLFGEYANRIYSVSSISIGIHYNSYLLNLPTTLALYNPKAIASSWIVDASYVHFLRQPFQGCRVGIGMAGRLLSIIQTSLYLPQSVIKADYSERWQMGTVMTLDYQIVQSSEMIAGIRGQLHVFLPPFGVREVHGFSFRYGNLSLGLFLQTLW